MRCSKRLQKPALLSRRIQWSLIACIVPSLPALGYPYSTTTKSIPRIPVASPRQWLGGEKVRLRIRFLVFLQHQANDEADAYAVTNNVVELRDNYPWADLKGTVVDIGGGSGHVSMELAKVGRVIHTPST